MPDEHENTFGVSEVYIPQIDRYYVAQGRLANWAGHTAHIEYMTDITETKRAQQKLSEMLQNVSCGIVVSKISKEQGILEIQYINDSFCKLFEDTEEALRERIRTNPADMIAPQDLDKLHEIEEQLLQNCCHTEVTLRFLFPGERIKWIHIDLNTVGHDQDTATIYASYYDVTRQMQQELELKSSEHILDIATEETGLWAWKYDFLHDRAFFTRRTMHDFDLPAILENYPQTWLDKGFILPDYHAPYMEAAQKIKEGAPKAVFQMQGTLKSGEIHWYEVQFIRQMDTTEQPGIAICTARNIDDEKALSAKYELERQKPMLDEKSLLFHAIFDLQSGETLEYGGTNPSANLQLEYPGMAQAIKHILDCIVGEAERAKFLSINSITYLMEQLALGVTSYTLEYRRRISEGQILWVRNVLHLVMSPSTKAPLLFEYCYDINASKMTQEVLRYAAAQDYEQIACVDFRRGIMTHYGVDDGGAPSAVLNYDSARREYARTTVNPHDRAQFLRDCAPKTVTRQLQSQAQYSFITGIHRPDGAHGIIKSRFLPYDPDNQMYIMAQNDITDLFRQEEKRNNQMRETLLIAQQANSAKSEFLSAMSHDIRTPLNAVVGMCELALADEDDRAQVSESLHVIQTSSQLLLGLINNVLDMTRIESGKLTLVDKPFSLREGITRITDSYRVLSQQKLQKFDVELNITHDDCLGDISRIDSVVGNILSNAVKYTLPGGTITLRVSEIPVETSQVGRYRFEISDTGIGIGKEDLAHIFEPFYRGEATHDAGSEGTGLGLPIVKAIVDLTGGTISCKSELGIGSTFVVELPIHLLTGEEISHIEPVKTAPKARLDGIRILVCEDHPVNQKVAVRILEKAGADVTVVSDGQRGYELFTESPDGFFDVILMDIRMPRMDGYQATKAIRMSGHPQAKAIPIIAMTANAFAEDIQKSHEAGMNEHLAKPIMPQNLYATILKCLKRDA